MKEHKAILALLGVGALIVLIYLLRRSASAPAVAATAAEGQPTYPNSQPIKLGDINIGGSPFNLTYNNGPLPSDMAVTDDAKKNGCCGEECLNAGQIVAKNQIPIKVLAAAAANFAGFVGKGTSPVSSAPVAPVNPTTFVNYYDFGAVNF